MNLQTGAEFGDMTQILRNLGSCPPRLEFGAICKFSSRGNDAIYELFRLGPRLEMYGIPARRAIFEIGSNRAATMLAFLFFRKQILKSASALFVKFSSASAAAHKRCASFNRKKGDEEQAQVVVYSFII